MLKLLVVDNYDSFTFNLVQIIEQSGLCKYHVKKSDQLGINTVKEYDKIIFSPGPGIPYDNPIMGEIVKKFSLSKSILGICLGFQAIAEVFGGKLVNMNKPAHGIKKEITITDQTDYLFDGLPKNFSVGLYHSWEVSAENFPDELKITSISGDKKIMSLSHKTFDVRGVQFHPESIMTPLGKNILCNWLSKK
ncbi:MAG: aminodeoxychorismate/anthranilate synthase component II [Bacteroidota bacterium]